MIIAEQTVLDMCCGSRMFWFIKHDARALFSYSAVVKSSKSLGDICERHVERAIVTISRRNTNCLEEKLLLLTEPLPRNIMYRSNFMTVSVAMSKSSGINLA